MNLIGWVVTLALAAAGASCAAEAQGPQIIPLDLTGPRPTARLQLGHGVTGTAIFDTGAAASVIKPALATAAGLPNLGPARAGAPGGKTIEAWRTEIKGTLGETAAFGPAMAVAVDIPLPLPGVDAVISPGVFFGRLVRFDFAKSQATVLANARENRPKAPAQDYNGGTAPTAVTARPAAMVSLPGGRELLADLDTGYPGGLELPLEVAQQLPLKWAMKPMAPAQGVGFSRPRFSAQVAGAVRIGPLTIQDPEITAVDGAPGAKVGMEILRHTVVVLDPEAHQDWLLLP